MLAVIASVLAALAAALHVAIFLMESVLWRRRAVWRRFGVRDQSAADTIQPMAYNQGFYNLFLAIGTAVGLVLFWTGDPNPALRAAGRALVLFGVACMTAAAVVLVSTGRGYLRAALVQGTLPLAAFVLFAAA